MSKPVVVNIPHQLGRAEARKRIDEGAVRLMQQFGQMGEFKRTWDGDTLRFVLTGMGQEVAGLIEVADQDVRLEVKLPGILGMLANKVKGRVQKEGQILLENRKS